MPKQVWIAQHLTEYERLKNKIVNAWKRGPYTIYQWHKHAGGQYSATVEHPPKYVRSVGVSRSLPSLKLACLKDARAHGIELPE